MRRYRLYGHTLDSAVPFPELAVEGHGVPSWASFEIAPCGSSVTRRPWLQQLEAKDGRPWLSAARTAGGYLLHFPGLADFVASRDRRRIVAHVAPGTSTATVRHLFLDQVVPLLLTASDVTVLHASAVAIDAVAVGFVGDSGQGKSTLAALLWRSLARVVSDDCLVLFHTADAVEAVPSYPGLRLWPDSLARVAPSGCRGTPMGHHTSKRRLRIWPGQGFADAAAPLHALFFLDGEPGRGQVEVEPVSRREAFARLLESSYRLEVDEPERHRAELDRLADLTDRVAVLRLRFRREHANGAAIVAEVRSQLDEASKFN